MPKSGEHLALGFAAYLRITTSSVGRRRLNIYIYAVIAAFCSAKSALILGPGEA